MRDEKESQHQQRVLGYPCIFTRTLDEAAASLLRAITAESGGISGGASVWLERIEGWLSDGEQTLDELNFSGARFIEAEWREILGSVAAGLRRHLTTRSTGLALNQPIVRDL